MGNRMRNNFLECVCKRVIKCKAGISNKCWRNTAIKRPLAFKEEKELHGKQLDAKTGELWLEENLIFNYQSKLHFEEIETENPAEKC